MPQFDRDSLGAFCAHCDVHIKGARRGMLAGLTFAAKDIFDIEGFTCCAGNPDWLRTHTPAFMTAPAVQMLLDAGATLVGKTLTDELAFSVAGENAHYGMPMNPRALERTTGGSSCGSASAVAAGVVDFALGTDTGGSVRIPASYCGLYGIRPTHGGVPIAGVMPHVPSADTVGWMACGPTMLRRVGETMLRERVRSARTPAMLIADDAFEVADEPVRRALEAPVGRLARVIGKARHVRLSPNGLDEWCDAYLVVQNIEVWNTRQDWIEGVQPDLGEPIRERLEMAARQDSRQLPDAEKIRAAMRAQLDAMLRGGAVICLPTAPCVAPLRGRGGTHSIRAAIMKLTCIASLGGFPQINLPLAEIEECPVGLSLMSARGSDAMLLALAEKVGTSMRRRTETVSAGAKLRSRARKPRRGPGSRR